MDRENRRKIGRRSAWLLLLLLLIAFITPTSERSHRAPNVSTPQVPIVQTSARPAQPAQSEVSKHSEFETVFASFNEWARKAAAGNLSADEIQKGVELAKARRAALAQLIESDPKAALENAVPGPLRKALPDAVTAQLEKAISARGNYSVSMTDYLNPSIAPKIDRQAVIDGQTYRAFVYGKRLWQMTKVDIPMHGIAIGDALAIHESPLHVLSPEEVAALDPNMKFANVDGKCPMTGQPVKARNVVDVGGTHYLMCCEVCPGGFSDQLSSQLTGPNPKSGSSTAASDVAAFTPTVKTVLVVIADFTDVLGAPLTNAQATTLVDTTISNFYQQESYGLISMKSTLTPLVHLPNTQAYYSGNPGAALSDGPTAATGAGFTPYTYDFVLILTPKISGGVAGIGWVGASGAVAFGYFDLLAPGHEMGHNIGCFHANVWNCTDGTIIGAGSNTEYGNLSSIMGFDDLNSVNAKNHDAQMKNSFGWLPNANVTTVPTTPTTTNTYTIHAFDDPTLNPAYQYALKIHNPTHSNDYWVELRQQWTANQFLMNGAELVWSPWASSAGGTELLNTNPGTGYQNSALVVGRTFSDPANNLYITTLAHSGTTTGNQTLDIQVNIGPFPGNGPPTCSVGASATKVGLNTNVTLTATASDPDSGDTLAYYWDFGDGKFSTDNQPSEIHSWTAAGTYTVKCSASDMKGHTTTGSISITVTSLSITTASPLGGGDVGLAYSKPVSVTGGTATYTWSLIGAPAWLSIGASGTTVNLTGTPTSTGTFTFTVQVNDSAATFATKSYSLTINPAPSITSSTPLKGGDISTPYSLTLTNSGGTAPFTWSLSPGPLPAGLSLSAAGVISGTPTALGTANFTVKVTDTFGGTATQACSLTINPLPTITTTSPLPNANNGVNYPLTFATAGGTAPFTWLVTVGSLPTGITLSAGGVLSGKPTAPGVSNFTVQATDVDGGVATKAFVLTTDNIAVLSSITVAPATVTLLPGNTQAFTASGLDQFSVALFPQPTMTWSVASGGTIDATGLFTAGTAGGTFTVTAASGAVNSTASVVVDAPTLASPPSVNPTTIQINVPTTFSASASDPTGATITYTWNFGDGTTSTGGTVVHTFTSAGSFTVTLTMTNSAGGSSTSTMSITVLGPSTIPMTVSKVQGSAKFTGGGHDSCSISGVIPNLPKGFDTTGQSLVLNIDGASVTFKLDGKGKGKASNGSISLKLKPTQKDPKTKKTLFLGGNVVFGAKIQNGTWAGTWGLDPKATVSGKPLSLPATIDLGGNTYAATVTAMYSSKAGSGGKFKK